MAQVRVMTWNVENLFLPGDDAGPDTQATFDRKTAALAAVIDAETPDVLALQEVRPPEALDDLRGTLTHHLPHAELGRAGLDQGAGIPAEPCCRASQGR